MFTTKKSIAKVAVFIPSLLTLLVSTPATISLTPSKAQALCIALPFDKGFEEQNAQRVSGKWTSEGRAGIDRGLNYSFSGKNNAWMRNVSGWNGIRQRITLQPNTQYKLTAYVRTSANVTDGYLGVRDARQKVYSELKFGSSPNYKTLTLQFRTNNESEYNIFTGFWALGQDSWVQVDDYSLTGGSCNDTP
jgi:hypothetical protein